MRSHNHPIIYPYYPVSRSEDQGVVRGDQYADAGFLHDGAQPLAELAFENMIDVPVDEEQDRVTELFDKYNLLALPVVDAEGMRYLIPDAVFQLRIHGEGHLKDVFQGSFFELPLIDARRRLVD